MSTFGASQLCHHNLAALDRGWTAGTGLPIIKLGARGWFAEINWQLPERSYVEFRIWN
jgi:hypothetical protein